MHIRASQKNKMKMTLIEKAEYLTQTKGKVLLTFRGGTTLTGYSRGIYDRENEDGDYIGEKMLFDSTEIPRPVFVLNEDLVAVEQVE